MPMDRASKYWEMIQFWNSSRLRFCLSIYNNSHTRHKMACSFSNAIERITVIAISSDGVISACLV